MSAFSTLFPMLNGVYSFVDVSSVAVNRIIITPTDLAGVATKGGIALDDITFGVANTSPPPTTVPEPASLTLIACGAAVLAVVRRQRVGAAG